MIAALDTINRAKILCTGAGLSTTELDVQPTCHTDSDFGKVVSTYYQFYRESVSDDVLFLRGVRRSAAADRFNSTITKLRTGAQHSTDPDAKAFFDSWLTRSGSPHQAAAALSSLLLEALSDLAQTAIAVSRDATASSKWRETATTDISAILVSVLGDLGLKYSAKRREWYFRQVESRLKFSAGNGPRRAVVMDYCIQVVLSQHAPLPVSYTDVLDHLGLLGDVRAEGAILSAFTVASIAPNLRGRDFIDRVEETWRAAAAY